MSNICVIVALTKPSDCIFPFDFKTMLHKQVLLLQLFVFQTFSRLKPNIKITVFKIRVQDYKPGCYDEPQHKIKFIVQDLQFQALHQNCFMSYWDYLLSSASRRLHFVCTRLSRNQITINGLISSNLLEDLITKIPIILSRSRSGYSCDCN